jgi:alpha-tubulin suppressor-like RCC1 family protein
MVIRIRPVFAALIVIAGCVTDRIVGPTTVFTVGPQNSVVQSGMILQLSALFSAEGPTKPSDVTWKSSDTTVAKVDASGLVSAVGPGKATVTAKADSVSESTTVTVLKPAGTTIVSGGNTTCGITSGSDAVCFGDNSFGQTGTLLTGTVFNPAPVVASVKWKSLSMSWNHTCGIDSQNDIYCWGLNASGQLGIGTNSDPVRPSAKVAGNNKWVAVSTGGTRWVGTTDIELNDAQETCALTTTGAAYCWGVQGNAATTGDVPSNAPVAAATGFRFAAISVGSGFVCGIAFDGRAFCWGNNELGQLGRAQAAFDRGPKPVEGGRKFIAISAGGVHACGIAADSTAYCWGGDDGLQLGSTSTEQCIYRNVAVQCQTHPIAVPGGYKFLAIAAGGWPQPIDPKMGSHSCGITTSNDVVCWGNNRYGQVRGYLDDLAAPKSRGPTVAELAGIKFRAVSVGSSHTCAVTIDGRGYCFGDRPSFFIVGSSSGFRTDPNSLNGGFIFK